MIVLLLALLACKDDRKSGSDTSNFDFPTVSALSATVSDEISSVVTITWTTDAPARGFVEFGEGYALSTPLETTAAIEHKAILLGLTPSTTAPWRVVLAEGNDRWEGEDQTVTTGTLPPELAGLTVTGSGNNAWMAVPVLGTNKVATIIGPEGKFVWWWFDERDLDTYRVRLSNDGTHVLYNAASISGDPAENSAIVEVAIDGSEESTIEVPLLAHDFVELPDGTITAIVVEFRELDGEQIRGDQLVEIAPDGTQTVVWSAWDCFDPTVDWGDDSDFGWTFANALDYSEADDAWLLSIRNFSTIVQIDRASGTCDWAFGTTGATFGPASGSATFLHEHQFERNGDRLLVFDNEGASGSVSRVVEYDFDPDQEKAEEIWSYTADPSVYSFVLGDVHRFDDGDTLVTWSVGGQIDRVDAAGTVKWRVNAPLGTAFGFDAVLDDLYPTR